MIRDLEPSADRSKYCYKKSQRLRLKIITIGFQQESDQQVGGSQNMYYASILHLVNYIYVFPGADFYTGIDKT